MKKHTFNYTLTLAGRFSTKILDVISGTVESRSATQAEIDAIQLNLRSMGKARRKEVKVNSVLVCKEATGYQHPMFSGVIKRQAI